VAHRGNRDHRRAGGDRLRQRVRCIHRRGHDLGHTIKVEPHDKSAALKLLGQRLGVLNEPAVQVSLGKDFATVLDMARQRVLDALRGRLIEGERIKSGLSQAHDQ
jgi:hypothetical protein